MTQRKKHHEIVAETLAAKKAEKPEEQVKPVVDLDDAKRQSEIMDPEGSVVTLSFGDLRLYPFTMDHQAGANGFCKGILADAIGTGARNPGELALRIPSVLLRNVRNRLDLLEYVAVASGKPGTMDSEDKVKPIIDELRKKLVPEDYVTLFQEISERSAVKHGPKT